MTADSSPPSRPEKPKDAPATQPLPRRAGSSRLVPVTPGSGKTGELSLRARNIFYSIGMIGYLLLRYVFVKRLGSRLTALKARAALAGGRVLTAISILLTPHVTRLKTRAAASKNRLVRQGLEALIRVVVPAEQATAKSLERARREAARLRAEGARKAGAAAAPVGSALRQAAKAGFKKNSVQRLLTRLNQILEEAER